MYYYLKMWVELCRLRIGPQNIPFSHTLLLLALCAYVLSNIAISLVSVGIAQAVMVSFIDALLLTLFLRLTLYIRGASARFIQTLTALMGVGALVGLLVLPLIQVMTRSQLDELPPPPVVLLLWVFLVLWSLVIMGHILRHALSLKLSTGIAVGVLYTMLSFMVVQSIFPMAMVE
ncbi:MAG: hypothetical protein GXP22_06235 [Gammaproteobacteria bacterium]|nr:hypothetical protein [Gammaproteobacteria bacterium]